MHFQWIFLGTLNTNLFQLLNVNFYITLKCKIISYDNGSCKIPSLEGRTQHILPSVGKRINPLSILYNLCILLLKIKKKAPKKYFQKKTPHTFLKLTELWCWRRLLRVPWTARRSNQSILKEISPDCSLERLMLKSKFQYFGHLMQRTELFTGKDPDAGKDLRREEKG